MIRKSPRQPPFCGWTLYVYIYIYRWIYRCAHIYIYIYTPCVYIYMYKLLTMLGTCILICKSSESWELSMIKVGEADKLRHLPSWSEIENYSGPPTVELLNNKVDGLTAYTSHVIPAGQAACLRVRSTLAPLTGRCRTENIIRRTWSKTASPK